MQFQAKEIQSILSIPKHRYDYSIMKIGINPDIEQASGRGKTNIFSFHGLMEFAIATVGIDIGINPNGIRFSIDTVNRVDMEHRLLYFDPNTATDDLYYHYCHNNGVYSCLFTGDIEYSVGMNDFNATGYSTLNLGEIKRRVVLRI